MRYLIATSWSRSRWWMSDARRLRASKTVESTSFTIGDESDWILSIDRTSSPSSSSLMIWMPSELGDALEHALGPLPLLERFLDGPNVPTAGRMGVCRRSAISSTTGRSVGSAMTRDHAVTLAPVGQEGVAEHQLHRDRLEQLGIGRIRADVHVLEAVLLCEPPGGGFLFFRRQAQLGLDVRVQRPPFKLVATGSGSTRQRAKDWKSGR